METLAKRVKAARTKAGLRQEDVAAASGLKQSDISKIENGSIQKTTGIVALARALGVDPDWLATGEGEMVRAAPATPVGPLALLSPEELQARLLEHLESVRKLTEALGPVYEQRAKNAPKAGSFSAVVQIPDSVKANAKHSPVSKKNTR